MNSCGLLSIAKKPLVWSKKKVSGVFTLPWNILLNVIGTQHIYSCNKRKLHFYKKHTINLPIVRKFTFLKYSFLWTGWYAILWRANLIDFNSQISILLHIRHLLSAMQSPKNTIKKAPKLRIVGPHAKKVSFWVNLDIFFFSQYKLLLFIDSSIRQGSVKLWNSPPTTGRHNFWEKEQFKRWLTFFRFNKSNNGFFLRRESLCMCGSKSSCLSRVWIRIGSFAGQKKMSP